MIRTNTTKIQFRAYEYKWLERSIKQIKVIYTSINKYNKSPQNNQIKFINLPKKHSSFTIIRSPHVDKRSGEKFTKIIYKKNIIMKTVANDTPFLYESLLYAIKQINWLGTEVQITSYTSTKKYKITSMK